VHDISNYVDIYINLRIRFIWDIFRIDIFLLVHVVPRGIILSRVPFYCSLF
jgi:hypothetical protein